MRDQRYNEPNRRKRDRDREVRERQTGGPDHEYDVFHESQCKQENKSFNHASPS